jgi:hypothetical protein
MRHLHLTSFALLCALLAPALALAVPTQLTQEGRLVDDDTGAPIVGQRVATFSIYDAAEGGEPLWSDTLTITLDEGGYFVTTLGTDDDPIDDAIFASDATWLEFALDSGAPMTPRLPITSVPYAARASVADALSGSLDFGALDAVPDGLADGDDDSLAQLSCAQGDAPLFDGAAWGCAPLGADRSSRCTPGSYAVGRLADGDLDCLTPSFDDLADVPPDLADGDSDLLSSLVCGRRQRLLYDTIDGWTCADNIEGSCGFGELLAGVRADGSLDCVNFLSLLSLLSASCPQGSYLSGINGITPRCETLPDAVAALDVLGLSPTTPAASCADARASGLGVDGPVWIQRAGDPEPVQRHCMHSLADGDWLLLHSSVAAPMTKFFWRIPFAERLARLGRPSPDTNAYDGDLYTWTNPAPRTPNRPLEILDVAEDLRGRRVVLVRADADGFDPATMSFTNPSLLQGDTLVYDAHVSGGWSSFDQDADPNAALNCADDFSSTQHYGSICLIYSLGHDSDDPAATSGPHIERSAALRLGLFADADASAHVPLRRLARYVRY